MMGMELSVAGSRMSPSSMWCRCSVTASVPLHIITRAKKNCTVYEGLGSYKGKGCGPVHGPSVHLQDIFVTDSQSFQTAGLEIYGAMRDVRFLSRPCLEYWYYLYSDPKELALSRSHYRRVFPIVLAGEIDAL